MDKIKIIGNQLTHKEIINNIKKRGIVFVPSMHEIKNDMREQYLLNEDNINTLVTISGHATYDRSKSKYHK
jgi:hypothetical protein